MFVRNPCRIEGSKRFRMNEYPISGSKLGLVYQIQCESDRNYLLKCIAEAPPQTIGVRYFVHDMGPRSMYNRAVFITPRNLDDMTASEAKTVVDCCHPTLQNPREQGRQMMTGESLGNACSNQTKYIFLNQTGNDG